MKRYSILLLLILAVMLVLAHLLARHGVNSWMFYPAIIFGWMFGLVVGFSGLFGGGLPEFLVRLIGRKEAKNISKDLRKDLLGSLSYDLFIKALSLVLLTAYWSWIIMQQPHDWDVKLVTASWLLVAFYSLLVRDTQKYLEYLHRTAS